ncbi:MAG TPA: DNA repair protein RadC [Firmicutes bacterium]|nr:DNA repair protein RadC [Bacillota bacterium]
MKHGAAALLTAELVAIVLRTGSREGNVVEVAHELMKTCGGLRGLAEAAPEELARVKGIGLAKAIQLKAALELGRRVAVLNPQERFTVSSPVDVVRVLMPEARHLDREYLKVVLLNTRNQVLNIITISVGSLDTALGHPREVFKEAIRRSSAGIILVHNHPSGDPTPSVDDVKITERLIQAGKILGIDVLDHIILGDNKYFSMREKGLLEGSAIS